MAKQEQHLTTARLSAFIDGQLSPEEQTQTEAHLQNCAVCQQQLAELRHTVALLHALPQPPLPRSFVLPTAEPALASSKATPSARLLFPVTPLPRKSGWPPYITGAIRTVSSLAALIGIVFLLSGLSGMVTLHGGTTNSGTSTTASNGSSSGGSTPQNIPHLVGTTYQGMTPSPTSTPGSSVTGRDPNGHPVVQQNPLQSFFSVDMIGTRALLGTLLLVLGIIGFIILRRL